MEHPGWRNWARTAESRPEHVVRPRDVEELSDAVAAAGKDGRRIKAVGAGHSFTDIATTDGVLLRLDAMSGLTEVDVDNQRVTARPGTPLHELNVLLDLHGLALSNLGDIDRQTIAGAISTGTHGTGLRYGNLSSQVVGLELVLADGSVVSCSADERPDLFAAARVGLGALGIISSVTLACEPAFALSAKETPMRLDDVLAGLDELVDAHDHVEFYWFPYTDRALVKANDRVRPGSPLRPLGGVRRWFDDELMNNGVYEAANRLMTRVPRLAPTVNATAARAWGAREYVDRSYAVFTSPRRVVFREMEYAVPREALSGVLGEVRQWIDRSDERIAFPLELRCSAPDDAWLSPAYERESGYIAVHQYHRMRHEPYFRAVEEIVRSVDGRPHWGKLHWRTAEELRGLYPRFDDFLRVRAESDPGGSFGNAYLDRVLGPS